jgi:hypothetical protein
MATRKKRAKRAMPMVRPFVIAEVVGRPVRKGMCRLIMEYLKTLLDETPPQGLTIDFATRPGGSAAMKRLAVFAREDGFVLHQRLVEERGSSRYVWLQVRGSEES